MDLERWMDVRRERLEQLLTAALAQRSPPSPLGEALGYALLGGGKRLRPLLVFAFAEASGLAESSQATDDAAVAIEFIHAYSLVHDDLPAFDDAATRRGQPSCHVAYGQATAVLVGDGLLTDAFAMLSRGTPAEAALRLRLVLELAQAAGSAGMVGGQQLDMNAHRPATLESLAQLHALKTGALLRAACRLGALSAQVSEERLAQATHYGQAVGLAFQIADDILDETAHTSKLGKPTKADASAGKVTYPSLLGLDESRRLAHEQVHRAQAAATAFGDASGVLAAIASYAVERTS